ncbi:splicing factor 1-like [Amphibalanus amphitrite]|uniref:splicing factor 1-like n=1 Tax=Amphibalanus amphitrite TaxID=1232801 RepID=UPI001C923911|nr:splicing factor 1-like [Amphibalanus amphitrite]
MLGRGQSLGGGALLSAGYLSGQMSRPPPPLAITSGQCQDRPEASDLKRKDRHGNGASGSDAGSGGDAKRKKKRRSRWESDENDKTFIPGMPTTLPTNLDKSQEQAYLLQLQIEDCSRRLRSGDLGIPSNPEQRSPSPEPVYGANGKRLNTREYRTRRRLEEERHKLVQKMLQINAEYKPPAGYKPSNSKVTEKIAIPQDEHPDINFVGLLIGPRGNTLRALEQETGARIVIRGKGSVKEGKVGRRDGLPMPGEDEPLHALVSSLSPECVERAVARISEIIRQAVELPDGENDLRRSQLRELALLNGTLRDQDGQRCINCGADNHKTWQCQDKPNVTNNIVCTSCGSAGHVSRDCRQQRCGLGLAGGEEQTQESAPDPGARARIDEEYLCLMAELGEAGPPPGRAGGAAPFGGRPGAGGGGQRWPGPPPARTLLNQPPPPPPPPMSVPPPNGRPPVWADPASSQAPPPPFQQAPPPPFQQGPPPAVRQAPPPAFHQGLPPPVQQGPPPALHQGPPPSGHQGPPPTGAARPDLSAPPGGFRAPLPGLSQSGDTSVRPSQPASSGSDSVWQSPWQQGLPPLPVRTSAAPGARPLGPPPTAGLPPWQPHFGVPSLHLGPLGGRTMDGPGLPDLLAAPPPPPPN